MSSFSNYGLLVRLTLKQANVTGIKWKMNLITDQHLFPEEIYKLYLFNVNNIKFTPREIDISACILHGKSNKGIAKFLSSTTKIIGERAIDTHILNIRRKIGGNSKESIIDFFEKSDKYSAIKYYYNSLLIQKEFSKNVSPIKVLLNELNPHFELLLAAEEEKQYQLATKLRNIFLHSGFDLSLTIVEKSDPFLIPRKTTENYYRMFLYPDKDESCLHFSSIITNFHNNSSNSPSRGLVIFQPERLSAAAHGSLQSFGLIELNNFQNEYFLFFTILLSFFPQFAPINELLSNFTKQYNLLSEHYSAPITFRQNYNFISDQHENYKILNEDQQSSVDSKQNVSGKYYLCIIFLIFVIVGKFVLSRYFFDESSYSVGQVKQLENLLTVTINKLDVNAYKPPSLILDAHKLIDEIFVTTEASRATIDQSELDSKLVYVACILASYYKSGEPEVNSQLNDYLKSKYGNYKWFLKSNSKDFYKYVATNLLEKLQKYYAQKYAIDNDEKINILQSRLKEYPFAAEDYTLLNYHIADLYLSSLTHRPQDAYKFQLIRKHLAFSWLEKEQLLEHTYKASTALLVLEREEINAYIAEIESFLRKTFPVFGQRVKLVNIIKQLNSSDQIDSVLKKLSYEYATELQIKESKLGQILQDFLHLIEDGQAYIAGYKPWLKLGEKKFIPAKSAKNRALLCTEIIHTIATSIYLRSLVYFNDPSKLEEYSTHLVASALHQIQLLLKTDNLNDLIKNDPEIEIIKQKLAQAIKNMAHNYEAKSVYIKLTTLAELIISNKFEEAIKLVDNISALVALPPKI